jgi:hypothetical protein
MNVQQSNLLFALQQAIISQARCEADHGFHMESSLLAGFKDLFAHIQQGGQITIVPSDLG